MSQLQEYKCPACGGALAFDSKLQKMKCPYCDSVYEMAELQEQDKDLDKDLDNDTGKETGGDGQTWDTTVGSEWSDGETAGLKSYVCQSCGGEIVGDDTTAATSCPFCGNPVVMKGQFTGELRPDCVIPFKLDKKDAKAGLMKHLQGKRFLPKIFKSQNHIDEIKGVYIPFWLFDADADADIRYKATRERAWSDSDYDYIETSYYSVIRAGQIGFDGIAVDGSSKMADDMMESIEPFDLSEAVDFQTAYLAGYLADKYDVTADDCVARANERVTSSTEESFAATVSGYDTVETESSDIRLSNGKARYALYPVWLLNTTWQGKQYAFAMNGQTGKFIGDLPVDKGAYWRWFGMITALFGAATYGAAWIINML